LIRSLSLYYKLFWLMPEDG